MLSCMDDPYCRSVVAQCGCALGYTIMVAPDSTERYALTVQIGFLACSIPRLIRLFAASSARSHSQVPTAYTGRARDSSHQSLVTRPCSSGTSGRFLTLRPIVVPGT